MVTLTKNEKMLDEKDFSSSPIFSFIKNKLSITNRRFLAKWRIYKLGIIPTGVENITYTLDNISSVTVNRRFSFGSLFVGLIVTSIAFSVGNFLFTLFLLLLGINTLLNSMRTELHVTNNSGQSIKIPVVIWQRAETVKFADTMNNMLAERAEKGA